MKSSYKKNILFVEGGMGFGGSAVSLYQIVKNLKNFHPVIVFFAPKNSYFLQYFNKFQSIYLNLKFTYVQKQSFNRFLNGLTKHRFIKALCFKAVSVLSYIYDKITLMRLFYIIKSNNIIVIHANNSVNQLILEAARLSRIPCICHLRGHINNGAKPSAIDYISYAIAPTEKIADYAKKQLGVKAEKIKVLYNTIDTGEFNCPKKRIKIRNHYCIRDGTFVVSMFARIRPMKGQILIVEAITELLRKKYDVVCMLVGDRSDFGDDYQLLIEKHIQKSGFKERFILTGYQADIAGFYAAADIIVHPSIAEEAFGRVIIESWAAGKPILASDIGASIELIKNEQDGIIVPKSDSKQIANGLVRLIDDKKLRRRLVANGHCRVQQFENKYLVEELEAIYERLTSPPESSLSV